MKKPQSRPLLTIRASHEAAAPMLWHFQAEGISTLQGELNEDAIPELLREHLTAASEIILLIPASRVLFHSLTLPGQPRRTALQPLLWQLEESSLSTADELHATLLQRDGDKFSLAAVDKSILKSWLVRLAQVGISPTKALPDVLALPLTEAGGSAVLLDDQWLVRLSPMHGFSASAEQLPVLCQSTDTPAEIIAFGDALPNLAGWRASPCGPVMGLLADGARQSNVNLLSGPFARRPPARFHWRPLLAMWGIWLLTLTADPVLNGYRLHRQAEQLQQRLQQQTHQLLPELLPSAQPVKALSRHLHQLEERRPAPGLLAMLAENQPLLNKLPAAELSQMTWEADTQTLTLLLEQTESDLVALQPPGVSADISFRLQAVSPHRTQLILRRKQP